MADVIVRILQGISVIFIIRALISWVQVDHDNPLSPVIRLIYKVTEPVLAPLRRVLPNPGGIDLSVIAIVFFLNWVMAPVIREIFQSGA